MKTKIYLLFLQIALLIPLFTSGQEVPASTQPETQIGMTVFNENTIHVENNALTAINIFTVVFKETATPATVIAFNTTPPSIKSKDFEDLNTIKKAPKPHKVAPIVVAKERSQNASKTLISRGNSPFGNHSLYRDSNNWAGIISPPSNHKQTTKKLPVASTEHSPSTTTTITLISQKQLFPSHEAIIISSNYSKTSRIRPPPFS